MSYSGDVADSFHRLVEEGLRWTVLLVEVLSVSVDLKRRLRSGERSHAEVERWRPSIPKYPRRSSDDERVEELLLLVFQLRFRLARDEPTDERFHRILLRLERWVVEPFQEGEEGPIRMMLGGVLVESSKLVRSGAS